LQAAPPPRCVAKIYHQFDFWIGEWEVFAPGKDGKGLGPKIGESSVTQEEAGCLLIEHWRGGKGANGQSYNFYDVMRKAWRQVWASPTELTDYAGALDAKGQMVLEGVSQQAQGSQQRSRGTWTANADGTVTQNFKSYDAKTKAWTDNFTGIYRKKA
jgi:hypothetical protein